MNTTETATATIPSTPATATNVPATTAKGKPDFGQGRYSSAMAEAYSDALRLLPVTASQAERFARALGSDLGAVKFDGGVKYGATNKDGKLTLREAATAKGHPETMAFTFARFLSDVNEAHKRAGKVPIARVTDCELSEAALEWLNKGK